MEVLEREFARAMRYKHPLSLAIIDIDHFKRINDTYGHQIGDVILTEFVNEIKNRLRKHDIIGRYGGEEFTILLPETPLKNAVLVLERHRKNIEDKIFANDLKIKITFSGGITGIPDVPAESVDEIIKYADNALYRAKELGRNKVEPADNLENVR
jgi:diguanylate cyclase